MGLGNNLGEINEILLKLKLIELRDTHQAELNGEIIESVGFDGVEYESLPNNTDLSVFINKDYYFIKNFVEPLKISKSGGRSKSDVFINGKGYSVKYMSGSPPAIINHTPRPGFEMACMQSGVNIEKLDKIINEYWNLRELGKISEDVHNSNNLSPFKHYKDYLSNIINYFLFDGSGRGPANHKAEYILDYRNPLNPNSWKIFNRLNFIDTFWDKMIFSLRSKGMPSNYSPEIESDMNIDSFGNSLVSDKQISINKWTKYSSGKFRGSLHLRIK